MNTIEYTINTIYKYFQLIFLDIFSIAIWQEQNKYFRQNDYNNLIIIIIFFFYLILICLVIRN